MNNTSSPQPGPIEYPEQFAQCCVALAEAAQRKIRIYDPTLDNAAFDSPELSTALASLARRSRACDIRILISDSRLLINRGHRLLALSRRLPSTIKIQKLSEHPELPKESFFMSDAHGMVYKPLDAEKQAFYKPEDRAFVQGYADRFDALWPRSDVDNELREMRL